LAHAALSWVPTCRSAIRAAAGHTTSRTVRCVPRRGGL
jgi:hypothetical protein